jgi:4-amino-4-deoxy-L-arabinose transferase-like glycosyltransferase
MLEDHPMLVGHPRRNTGTRWKYTAGGRVTAARDRVGTTPMGARLRDPRTALAVALVAGAILRLVRVAEWPLIHPDGPAYVGLARTVLDEGIGAVLGGYYSPLYPITIAPLRAAGIPTELAARLVAAIAGLLALPLLWVLARRIAGDAVAAAAVLVAAVHPALVKASAQVLPETLAGALLLAWGVVLMDARGVGMVAIAGALAGATYLARPEGVFLLVLGAGWLLVRRRPLTTVAVYVLATLLVMAPAVLALHDRTGTWQISRREAALTAQAGLGDQATLTDALRADTLALARYWSHGIAEQSWDTVVALGAILAAPFVVGLRTLPLAWPLAIAALFIAGPLALNPSPRYAVPILPLLLPWAAAGVLAITEWLGRRGTAVVAVGALVLAAQGIWKTKPFDEQCSREMRDLLLARYGPDQRLVAVDGRFAYVAQGKAIVPKSTQPRVALAMAREHGARLWLTRPQWLGKAFVAPPGVHEVARPCSGVFILYELDVPVTP